MASEATLVDGKCPPVRSGHIHPPKFTHPDVAAQMYPPVRICPEKLKKLGARCIHPPSEGLRKTLGRCLTSVLRKHFRTLALTFSCILLAATSNPWAATEKRAKPTLASLSAQVQLETLRAQVKAITTELKRELVHQRTEEAALEAVEVSLGNTTRALFTLERQRAALNKGHATLRRRSGGIEQQMARERRALAVLVRAAFSIGRRGDLQQLMSQASPADAGRAISYARYLHQRSAARVLELQALTDEQSTVDAELVQENRRIDAHISKTRTVQTRLEGQRDDRANVLARVNLRIVDKRETLSHLAEDEKRLGRLLIQLAKALEQTPQKRTSSTKRTRPKAPVLRPGPDTTLRRTELVARAQFSTRTGRLPWPVNGRVSNARGTPGPSGNLSGQGLWFTANAGDNVRAVSPGQVVFANWLRGFGLLLIIDHADGYMSLYGHNSTLLKEAGEWVDTGDVIALLGDSGGLSKAALYFELRKNGHTINPTRWLARNKRAGRSVPTRGKNG
ncbi:MAG: septal ring factor EnvC (AmiA/AmiB activator) [Gammaproteobacteria bacterium]